MSTSITLGIIDPLDPMEERQIAETLQKLVNNEIDPASVARDVDQIIVNECRSAHERYTSQPSQEDDRLDNASIRGPDPDGWQLYLWLCLGKAAMEIPADHPGQDRLIEFLQELQRLPKHNVPALYNGKLASKELWSLTPANGYEYLTQWLWEADQGTFTGWRQAETSSTLAQSYLNFSAFLARLLSQGIAEATRLSALIRPSPFAVKNPLTHDVKVYEPYAAAAAQWIFYAGDALFEMCEKDTVIEIGKQKWTRPLWDGWKTKFEAVKNTDRFSSQGREIASRAAGRMTQIESTGVTTNIVGHFGFMSQNEDGEYV